MTQLLWTDFTPFPDPRKGDYLSAPFGPGVYELRNMNTGELIYVGEGKNTASRMSSLLPAPFGDGTRNNAPLRVYIFTNLMAIEYRTLACSSKKIAKQIQDEMIAKNKYLFN